MADNEAILLKEQENEEIKPLLGDIKKQNIAYRLLSYIINNYDYENITLEVNINNIKAINLYKKLDFKIIATRPNYYNGVDGYLMERRVS